jgi:hypothetical protein
MAAGYMRSCGLSGFVGIGNPVCCADDLAVTGDDLRETDLRERPKQWMVG